MSSAPQQLVWIFCEDAETAEDIRSFCLGCRRQKLIPKLVERPARPEWLTRLGPLVPAPLAPYGKAEWEDFWVDVSVLFTASLATARLSRSRRTQADKVCDSYRHLQTMRWPALLVTDKAKLCRLTTNTQALGALADAASMQLSELIPVVLTSDLGLVTGNLVKGTPLALHKSLTMLLAASDASPSPVPRSRWVHVPLGVFAQHYKELSLSEEDTNDPTFGARCLALCGDGKCAYFAVSPDGVRAVQVAGPWRVVNAHLVLGGSSGKSAAKLLRLSRGGVFTVDVEYPLYSEPVHIPIEELETSFEPPLTFRDWTSMILGSGTSKSLGLSRHMSGPALLLETDDPTQDEPDATPPAAVEEALPHREKELQRLVQLAREQEDTSNAGGASHERKKFPRLLGFSRCLTASPQLLKKAGSMAFMDEDDEDDEGLDDENEEEHGLAGEQESEPATPKRRWDFATSSGLVASADGAMKRLSALAEACPDDVKAQSFPTCPLVPGVFHMDVPATSHTAARHLEMTLHATGRAEYFEKLGNSSLRSLPSAKVEWKVVDSEIPVLRLFGTDTALPAFQIREARGSRIIERFVASVEVPLAPLLSSCNFKPFVQQQAPFPGHTPLSHSERVFGRVDPDSPALATMKCRADRLPLSAFEHELRRLGMPVEEITSDFTFIDRDQDGQITVADMIRLEEYGSPVAAPEVIDELRSVLISAFGSLPAAFEAVIAASPGGKVTAEAFDHFLTMEPAPPKTKKEQQQQQAASDASRAKIQEWVSRTSAEDRAAVYASVNPSNCPHIELSDFLCLNLHTAVVSLRRLEHFQGWIFEQFGRNKQAFARVFTAIARDGKKDVINRKDFVDGAQYMGYPSSQKATRTIFSLLDRNFDGEVSTREFERLAEFQTEQFVASLEALQTIAEEKFNGSEECFDYLLKKEASSSKKQQGPKPTFVSFNTFQKVFEKAGLTKLLPSADLRMVFLFLDEASGKSANGQLTESEWSLLKGFSSRAITGSPARLRRILEENFGGAAQAFQHVHTAWLRRALPLGLRQIALMGLARAICELPGVGEEEDEEKAGEVEPDRDRLAAPVKVNLAAPNAIQKSASTSGVGWRPHGSPLAQKSSSATKLPQIHVGGGRQLRSGAFRARPAWALGGDTI